MIKRGMKRIFAATLMGFIFITAILAIVVHLFLFAVVLLLAGCLYAWAFICGAILRKGD